MNAHVNVDTHVSFPSRLPGRPLIGAGAKAKLIFAPDGRVTYLRFAGRELEQRRRGRLCQPPAAADRAPRTVHRGLPGGAPLTA